jgi:hypothetical protein
MAKVGVRVGYTFRVGPPESMNFARIDLDVKGVDTEIPLADQMKDIEAVADKIWKYTYDKVDKEMLAQILESDD